MSGDDTEVHPDALVTVNEYTPAASPAIVVIVPLPVVVTLPGILVSVHVPGEGRPVSGIVPDANVHVGCEMVPGTGADGVTGWGSIVILLDGRDVHPEEFVTVNV